MKFLVLKQNVNNVRFLSHDGKYTYYQNSSGELSLSHNYQNQRILKIKDANYSIRGSEDKKYLSIEVDSDLFTRHSINKKNNSLYII
mgnify:CR=1 FL=1